MSLPSFANVQPYSIGDVNSSSIGVYQVDNTIRIYDKPDVKANVLLEIVWNEAGIGTSALSERDVFVAFYPAKNLGFMTVMDESEDLEWVKVLYQRNKTGWVKKSDQFKYMNWRTFFGLYGRKYGLTYLKGVDKTQKYLYSAPEEEAKIISEITYPKAINVTGISGNWLLAIIIDLDKSQKIGWLRWRNNNGTIYLFPCIR